MGRLNAPKKNIWNFALILAIVALVLFVLPWVGVAAFFQYQGLVGFVLMTVAYVLLMLGTKLKGM